MRKGICGRADLLDAIRFSREAGRNLLPEMARIIGFKQVSQKRKESIKGAGSASRTELIPEPPQSDSLPSAEPQLLAPTPFWMPFEYRLSQDREEEKPDTFHLPLDQDVEWKGRPAKEPSFQPLTSRSLLWKKARQTAAQLIESTRLDERGVVDRLSRGEVLNSVPRLRRRGWGGSIQVILDHSTHLVPFWEDQSLVQGWLRRLFPRGSFQLAIRLDGDVLASLGPGDGRLKRYEFPPEGSLVLALSDLGCLAQYEHGGVGWWREQGRQLTSARCRPVALSPATPEGSIRSLLRQWTIIPWETEVPLDRASMSQDPTEDLGRLMRLLSPAVRLEPGLLRALRVELAPSLNAAGEAAVWQHSAIGGRSYAAAHLEPEAARRLLQEFEDLESDTLRERALALLRQWRQGVAAEVYFAEVMNLSPQSRRLLPEQDVRQAKQFFRALADSVESGTGSQDASRRRRVVVWAANSAKRATDSAHFDPEAGEAFRRLLPLAQRLDSGQPIDFDDSLFGGGKPRQWALWQVGSSFAARPQTQQKGPGDEAGSPLALISSANLIRVGGHARFWKQGLPPDWAHRWGRDAVGAWTSFRLGSLEQRMRWIPPGRFRMGSPQDEEGRKEDESPRHEVVISRGFWLFNAPCRQDLWESVMGSNPGRFKSPDRPVESMSWEDCQSFLGRLNERIPGLELRLPSEAQWEYACRAGSEEATYAGDLQIVGENDAPVLDAIAWYGGNSGVEFDLENGYDSSQWPEKQFEHSAAGTRKVKQKEPNRWGLYSMLGNVWEWCQDWYGSYSEARQIDPWGPEEGDLRVIRGGSWSNEIRYLRAACRGAYPPGSRDDDLGFRCARVQDGAEPLEAGRQAERRPEGTPAYRPAVLWVDRPGARCTIPSEQSLLLESDSGESLQLRSLTKPDWAEAIGRDGFGLWVEFALANEGSAVLQRMRWIPPGRFQMGSPQFEEGRREDEGPRHEVVISRGFWLFDAPCRQNLWEAVMSSNPSRFKSPERPVESVSWEDCQGFLARLNERIPGLELSLPSEAQWEYACRAGTEAATYVGDLGIVGERNAPLLDGIAWYGGNSGVEFDLDSGTDSSGWPEKQYEHKWAGTRKVMQKEPNRWGLFDMLGNVWERCEDRYGPYSETRQIDPRGPEDGDKRVIRGGSWLNGARGLRAACRDWDVPDDRSRGLGFRCARVQEEE